MNFFEKILVFLGLAEEAEEEIIEDEEDVAPVNNSTFQEKKHKKRSAVQRKQKNSDQEGDSVVPLHSTKNTQGIKIHLIAPSKYEEAQEIGKYLKSGFPVVVNLEQLEMETAKQMIDFVSGTVFALDGNLHKIGQQIFLFSPPNVGIDGAIDTTGDEFFDQKTYEEYE
ncbi:cell division protein SepF [Natranaerobius thermophilus]|uniref:Cell division protein SepF n=1 Tax=Natranaerobius thermophilus (strain ATCC BAA-1301 / DSM 18059 / JW/NM-WN-LF) TaxID=457570 RepID=SEPF_NATTJ|nr:cell division protein SepF [Natranaerobius thermophilus]B2A2I4.1 RecName: Full=Cell division protein SepF [Natranaerobius thermophilus JW/NM-WN-LF]ACB84899.1 protein of unknown function DUF552 [Natranaerobius thermophilus JW/NM-WN-LF]